MNEEDNSQENNERIESLKKELKRYQSKQGKFLWKLTTNQWLITLLLIGIIFFSYRYAIETQQCREAIPRLATDACAVCDQMQRHNQSYIGSIENITGGLNITFNESLLKNP